MSVYMSRLFPKSNSSFMLSSGNGLRSQVLRLREGRFLVDAGIGSPKICGEDELTRVPTDGSTVRFENKVGYVDKSSRVAGESLIRKRLLEKFFVDVVAGDPIMKERAAVKFNELMGSHSLDVVPGEPVLINPRPFNQKLVMIELSRIWRTSSNVKGFYIDKVRGGYSVAIAGFVAFLPAIRFSTRRRWPAHDRFNIERINPKKRDLVVF